jgi:predicted lipoprotein with Yx(FWY)xxD motif
MKKNTIWIIGILVAIIVIWMIFRFYVPASLQAPTVGVSTNSSLGSVLVGPNNMTLYFKQGDAGESSCYGQCASLWPPLQAVYPKAGSGVSGKLGIINRTDGLRQVTYNDMPLYYWSNDKAPGETTGNGVNGIWTIARP